MIGALWDGFWGKTESDRGKTESDRDSTESDREKTETDRDCWFSVSYGFEKGLGGFGEQALWTRTSGEYAL